MNALRRDLVERRLWPLVAVLLAAVVAIPLLLLRHAPASGARDAAPLALAVPVRPAQSGADKTPPAALGLGATRNPFAAGGTPKLTAKPGPSPRPATSSSGAPQAALVAPSPIAASPQASLTTTTTATTSVPPQSTSSQTTSTSTTTTTASTPPSTLRATTAPTAQSWTIYAVDLRLGKEVRAPIRHDVARLTLLPSPTQPELMFMGVTAGGRQAVFALGAGLPHGGEGLCKPRRRVCSTIVLGVGQAELITVPSSGAAEQQLILQLVDIRSRVTESKTEARTAYQRRSAAGQCDLDLAAPMSYDQSLGTLSAASATSCRDQRAAVPFPSPALSP